MAPAKWQNSKPSISGVGLGLRACHYAHILTHLPKIPWFEVLSENYFVAGGMVLERLGQIRAHYPIVLHGVGMSLGSKDPLNYAYLRQLKTLIDKFQPTYVSDHLCWSSFAGQYFHELLPLPYTEEAIAHLVSRIQDVQEFLGQQIAIENVSSYFSYNVSTLSEPEFLQAVAERADCFILLDINNVYVNSINHGYDAQKYLLALDKKRIKQLHLAGYKDCGSYLLDTHGATVAAPVWELYKVALQRFGAVPTSIEWDNDIPDFVNLAAQMLQAEQIQTEIICK